MPDIQKSSPEEILARINELGNEEEWFHCIDLGDGIFTMRDPVKHLQALWEILDKHIPLDLTGMSVLDIGCNAGFFSVAAKNRNAHYVLGVDTSPGYLRQAEFVRDVLRLDIDYRQMSVYELPVLEQQFDLVFCLGVIYHCSDPFLAAKNVLAATRDIAIIESAVMQRAENTNDRPLWEFVFPGYSHVHEERCYNWWFPNTQGLVALFRSAGFRSVEPIFESENRCCILCRV